MAKVNDIISIAQSWVGRNEKDGTHKMIIDLYNTLRPLPRNYKVKYNDAWCATFITALFLKANAIDLIVPECSCQKMLEGFRVRGLLVEDENRVPNVGDIVFYNWADTGKGDCKGTANHVGIVDSVYGRTFTVIEGNYNDAVRKRVCTIDQKYLRAFATPNYDKETDTKVELTQEQITKIAKDVIAGLYGNGVTRKYKLESGGYDYHVIQSEVNRLLKK